MSPTIAGRHPWISSRVWRAVSWFHSEWQERRRTRSISSCGAGLGTCRIALWFMICTIGCRETWRRGARREGTHQKGSVSSLKRIRRRRRVGGVDSIREHESSRFSAENAVEGVASPAPSPITLDERHLLARLRDADVPVVRIAERLDRHVTTILSRAEARSHRRRRAGGGRRPFRRRGERLREGTSCSQRRVPSGSRSRGLRHRSPAGGLVFRADLR